MVSLFRKTSVEKLVGELPTVILPGKKASGVLEIG